MLQELLQVLVTSNDFTDSEFKDNLCGTVEDLLSMNVVPVFNENDAISKGAARSKVTASAPVTTQAAACYSVEFYILMEHSCGSTKLACVLLATCYQQDTAPAYKASAA